MIQQYTFSGTGRQIDAQGVFFRYESGVESSGITDIRLVIDGNNVGTFAPGDSLELPHAAKRWEIIPVLTSCSGVVKVGHGKVTSSKLSGIVQTVDSAKSRSLDGSAFSVSQNLVAAGGNSAVGQLWNKSANKKLIINRLIYSTSADTVLLVNFDKVQLASIGNSVVAKSSSIGTSLASEIRYTYANTPPGNPLRVTYAKAFSQVENVMSEPIVLFPGRGLNVFCSSQNVGLAVNYEWFEEPV